MIIYLKENYLQNLHVIINHQVKVCMRNNPKIHSQENMYLANTKSKFDYLKFY